jgi:3-(methylsulfanyl)propanoyl-CoA dehydrogenase
MRTYDPPVKDYAFLLRHVIDAERVLEEVTGGAVGLEDAIDVIEGAGAVVAPIAALNAVGDEIGAKLVDGEVVTPPGFKEAFTSYAEGGWIGLSLPESIGGAGMPRVLGAAADEFLHGANPAFAMACGLGSYASWVFAQVDDPELRSTYAARLLSGEWSGTMDLSEPQAGTDLAAIRTSARPQADGTWKVSGQKIFISWGDHDLTENVVHLVLARTPDAPPGVGRRCARARSALSGCRSSRTSAPATSMPDAPVSTRSSPAGSPETSSSTGSSRQRDHCFRIRRGPPSTS